MRFWRTSTPAKREVEEIGSARSLIQEPVRRPSWVEHRAEERAVANENLWPQEGGLYGRGYTTACGVRNLCQTSDSSSIRIAEFIAVSGRLNYGSLTCSVGPGTAGEVSGDGFLEDALDWNIVGGCGDAAIFKLRGRGEQILD